MIKIDLQKFRKDIIMILFLDLCYIISVVISFLHENYYLSIFMITYFIARNITFRDFIKKLIFEVRLSSLREYEDAITEDLKRQKGE